MSPDTTILESPEQKAIASAPADEAPAPSAAQPRNEMQRLRSIILGDEVEKMEERVEDLGRMVTSRDARVRRLVEDIPEAITKNSVDQSSLTRLASALRSPLEEALHQSVKDDRQKVAGILAPAVGHALPRALLAFFLNLPVGLLRRMIRLVWPGFGRSRGSSAPNLILPGLRPEDDQPFQVERICLIERDTSEIMRVSDMGFDDDATALQVDHLFVQLRDEMERQATNPAALLRYPAPRKKGQHQGMMLLEGEHTTLAAYHIGKPASWLRGMLQEIADEADKLAKSAMAESKAGRNVQQQLDALDALLKKGLIAHEPPPLSKADKKKAGNFYGVAWLQDAAVVAAVIGCVWIVAHVSQASANWTRFVRELDKQPGIVVLDHSWVPGRSITGLCDPLAPRPAELVADHGYDAEAMHLSFTPFVSDEAPFRHHRESLQDSERDSIHREISRSYARTLALMEASIELQQQPAGPDAPAGGARTGRDAIRTELLRTIFELPQDAALRYEDGTVTIPDNLPKAVRDRVFDTAKSIPWLKKVQEAAQPAAARPSSASASSSAARPALAPSLSESLWRR